MAVYGRYRDDMKPILDQLTRLITDYADTHVNKNLTDEQALAFTDTYLNLQEAKLALRKKYVPKFLKILKPKQVAQFMQIENKLDAVMNYDLARKVPLVPIKSK